MLTNTFEDPRPIADVAMSLLAAGDVEEAIRWVDSAIVRGGLDSRQMHVALFDAMADVLTAREALA